MQRVVTALHVGILALAGLALAGGVASAQNRTVVARIRISSETRFCREFAKTKAKTEIVDLDSPLPM